MLVLVEYQLDSAYWLAYTDCLCELVAQLAAAVGSTDSSALWPPWACRARFE